MIRRFLQHRLDAAERQLGAPVDYMRFMLNTSLRSFLRFYKFIRLASQRRAVPKEVLHVASIVALLEQDCGPCVQIALNLARQDGVPGSLLRAVLDDRPDDLPDELADVYRFAQGVVQRTGAEEQYRERIRSRIGDEALIELSLGIAFAQVFPVTKRGMGYAVSCSVPTLQV